MYLNSRGKPRTLQNPQGLEQEKGNNKKQKVEDSEKTTKIRALHAAIIYYKALQKHVALQRHCYHIYSLALTNIPCLLLECFCVQKAPIHVCQIYQSKPYHFRSSEIKCVPKNSQKPNTESIVQNRKDENLPVSG
jgi:hypothetical protein